jgi:hypothetical protein
MAIEYKTFKVSLKGVARFVRRNELQTNQPNLTDATTIAARVRSLSVMDFDSSEEDIWSSTPLTNESFVFVKREGEASTLLPGKATSQRPGRAVGASEHSDSSNRPAVPAAHHVPRVFVAGNQLVDDQQRVLNLRGVSLSGNCKLPAKPDLPTHCGDEEAFFDTQVATTLFVIPRHRKLNPPLII